jgi:hypothetical protein
LHAGIDVRRAHRIDPRNLDSAGGWGGGKLDKFEVCIRARFYAGTNTIEDAIVLPLALYGQGFEDTPNNRTFDVVSHTWSERDNIADQLGGNRWE